GQAFGDFRPAMFKSITQDRRGFGGKSLAGSQVAQMLRDGSTVDDRAAVFDVQEAQIGHQRTLERSGTGPEEGIALLQRQLNGKADFVRPLYEGDSAIQAQRPTFHANLEALRGIAALLVVLHHLALNAGSFLASVPFLRQGWMFVDLFFVLSGYVIASVHAESEATGQSARRFLIRRFFRLYPLHLVTLVAALILVDMPSATAALPGYGTMVALNLSMTH